GLEIPFQNPERADLSLFYEVFPCVFVMQGNDPGANERATNRWKHNPLNQIPGDWRIYIQPAFSAFAREQRSGLSESDADEPFLPGSSAQGVSNLEKLVSRAPANSKEEDHEAFRYTSR